MHSLGYVSGQATRSAVSLRGPNPEFIPPSPILPAGASAANDEYCKSECATNRELRAARFFAVDQFVGGRARNRGMNPGKIPEKRKPAVGWLFGVIPLFPAYRTSKLDIYMCISPLGCTGNGFHRCRHVLFSFPGGENANAGLGTSLDMGIDGKLGSSQMKIMGASASAEKIGCPDPMESRNSLEAWPTILFHAKRNNVGYVNIHSFVFCFSLFLSFEVLSYHFELVSLSGTGCVRPVVEILQQDLWQIDLFARTQCSSCFMERTKVKV